MEQTLQVESENVCFSGGAIGSDTIFGEYALKNGHKVIHWGFSNMNSQCKNVKVINSKFLILADKHLKKANQTLKRKFPTNSEYVNNLLRRNFYQVCFSKKIYAIAQIEKHLVKGGTGWAVQMAIDLGVGEIYVGDQDKNQWYIFNGFIFEETKTPLQPTGRYAGIGTREINDVGVNMIKNLYEKEMV